MLLIGRTNDRMRGREEDRLIGASGIAEASTRRETPFAM
jgi:hypothetical protein